MNGHSGLVFANIQDIYLGTLSGTNVCASNNRPIVRTKIGHTSPFLISLEWTFSTFLNIVQKYCSYFENCVMKN